MAKKSNPVVELNDLDLTTEQILKDYHIAFASRQASLLGRKEVFMGKAKFGIFGDGKELPQVALAHFFKNGDFRSGYYRDQTLMFATGMLSIEQFFAQLFATPDIKEEPASGGRMMNGHFGTRLVDSDYNWINHTAQPNSSSDVSPTGSQMPRLLGLAYASKLYRENSALHKFTQFSNKGDEIAWGTIGNASTSEGMFYEAINAAGVLQVPMITSIWDDSYGISVPAEYHTTHQSISKALEGFQRTAESKGFEILVAKGWDYPSLIETYKKAERICREEHVPVIVHIKELTQPQGHSTSGSHERYKSAERLTWETEWDGIKKFREWIIGNQLASEVELNELEANAKKEVLAARQSAWDNFTKPIVELKNGLMKVVSELKNYHSNQESTISDIVSNVEKEAYPVRADVFKVANKLVRLLRNEKSSAIDSLKLWLKSQSDKHKEIFNSHLLIPKDKSGSVFNLQYSQPSFSESSQVMDGREVIRNYFDILFERDPRVFAIGEDVGKIGDVNQGFAGIQEKFGKLRLTDTGIRECTIAGQGIGAALRGLKPIVEIQYLDYLLYAIQVLSDDVATTTYRTAGGQKIPLIVRTRGHRLEGIWHSGSPMGMIIHAVRGMHVCVPRDFVRAAGFYNTLIASDEPGIVIECLNGYRLKEKQPDNLGSYNLALGVPEVLRKGEDITLVSYGSTLRIVLQAAEQLAELGISAEVIDIQTLLPFDTNGLIVKSLQKTNRVAFIDEDVPGGATSYMLQQVLEVQDGYRYLDSKPLTISAKAHRPAYSSDGDYFSKPNEDEIIDAVYRLMHEVAPQTYPIFSDV